MGMQRYNVRCCCAPIKILGTIELPSEGWRFTVAETTHANARNTSAVRKGYEMGGYPKRHTIEIKQFRSQLDNGYWKTERAVYSDDRPLSFWLKIPTFIPNQEYVDEPERVGAIACGMGSTIPAASTSHARACVRGVWCARARR